ncbi:alpha/beta hydrolase [uncultured Thiothrix sp.]|uniref:alpha/beta hydrolase n=1 Tax=uncultured Thiothrix sp. TaxID=223185 RepID=UPI002611A981|nr:alpha/beta hydrolase [uncultured Thiothrix sp.]
MSSRIQTDAYTHLLSADLWAFIHQSNTYFPDDVEQNSIEQQRLAYNAMLASLVTADPVDMGIAVQDKQLPTAQAYLPIRCYQRLGIAPAAHLVYFHGGGFVLGGLDSHHGICADLCAGTGLKITSVDYRLAPEHLFPAALEDAVLAYQALAEQETLPIILMGDSAGGCLAAHVAHASRKFAKTPLAQVLIYPVLGSDFSLDSYERYALAPMLTTESMMSYWRLWLGKEDIPAQLAGIPLADADFSGLPNAVIFSAEFDPLVGEASLYCDKIHAAGGQATGYHEQGLTHGYLHARHSVESARASFRRIQQVLKDLVA